MNHSLKPWNTFGIDHNAQHIVCAEDEQQLLNAWQHATAEGQPVLGPRHWIADTSVAILLKINFAWFFMLSGILSLYPG